MLKLICPNHLIPVRIFLITVVGGIVVSIAMQMMNMQLFEDKPSSQEVPEDLWIYSEERREILLTLTHFIYEFARCT